MSLQWTLIAVFLYIEIVVVILLLLPFIPPAIWQKFFKSKFIKSLGSYTNLYFTGFIIILLLCFIDSLREMSKYAAGREQEIDHGHLDAELQLSMKLFRAQRNSYVAGFSLFLAVVIRRLAALISNQAMLKAQCEASIKQAQSASATASKLLKEKNNRERDGLGGGDGESADNEGNVKLEEYERKIVELNEELEKSKQELNDTTTQLKMVKVKAEETNKEYDSLMKAHSELQNELKEMTGENSEKKKE